MISPDRSCILATLYKIRHNRETIVEHYYFTEKGYRKIKDEIEKLEKFIKQDIDVEHAYVPADLAGFQLADFRQLVENPGHGPAGVAQLFYVLGDLRLRAA